MLRLLWKEWHELKWYALALFVGPWALTLWPGTTLGYRTRAGASSWDIDVLLLMLAFWGATRMPGEMQAGRLTLRSLPAKPWQILLAKLLPGLLASIMLALWIHVTALVRIDVVYPENPRLPFFYTPAGTLAEHLARALALYTTTFAVSLFASSMVGVLVGFLVAFGGSDALESLLSYETPESAILGAVALLALVIMLPVWTQAKAASLKRKIAVGAVSALVGLPLAVAALFAVILLISGNRVASDQWATMVYRITSRYNSLDTVSSWDYQECLMSPDRTRAACVLFSPGRDKVPPRMQIHLRDRQSKRLLAEGQYLNPAAWLPDGSLLIIAADVSRRERIVEWQHETGRLRELASFRAGAEDPSQPRVIKVAPNADGSMIAVFAYPRRGSGIDLWMLGRESRRVMVAIAGFQGSPLLAAGWDGDRLVFSEYGGVWSIRSDGSGLKCVSEEVGDDD